MAVCNPTEASPRRGSTHVWPPAKIMLKYIIRHLIDKFNFGFEFEPVNKPTFDFFSEFVLI